MEIKLPSLFHEMNEFSYVKAFSADFEFQHNLRREMEDLTRYNLEDAVALVGFGRLSQFLQHRRTYEDLAQEARGVWIFADADEEWVGRSPHLHHINIPHESLLVDEPFFLVISSEISVGVICRSISVKTHNINPLPDYDILWSNDNDWVARAIACLKEIVPGTPEIKPPPSISPQARMVSRMMARNLGRLANKVAALRLEYHQLLQKYDQVVALEDRDSGQDPDSWLMTPDLFHDRLDEHIKLARRHEQPISVMTVAIERVEPVVNPEGLRALGAALGSVIRDTDFIGHLRQGVIAIGSPLTDAQGARNFEERLLARLEGLAEEFGGGELTVGIATRDKDGSDTAEDLIVYAEIDRLKEDSRR